ncbi:universal stress protein [Paucihalobacter sp.]|uniref:universal stress protein n=1 Tax=Paucihalobacter sp. TaxID=2850405 RepID=UPI002FDF94EE
MKTKQTILVPTDFSERANNALDQAIHLASKINAELVIYHVYHRPLAEESHKFTLTDLEKKIDKQFKQLVENIPGLKKIPHAFKKELGVSVDNIANKVNSNGIDMLVMATKGAKGINEIWGTKTAKIIKMIETPVIVIPDNTSLKHIKKVALACDYSLKINDDSIVFLTNLGQKLGFSIDVVTLNREEKTMTKKEHENRDHLIKQMSNVKTSFAFTQHPHIDKGIMEYSKANNIDAVVVLSKNYSFIESLFHESLTDKMVFNSPIPLMVI